MTSILQDMCFSGGENNWSFVLLNLSTPNLNLVHCATFRVCFYILIVGVSSTGACIGAQFI